MRKNEKVCKLMAVCVHVDEMGKSKIEKLGGKPMGEKFK